MVEPHLTLPRLSGRAGPLSPSDEAYAPTASLQSALLSVSRHVTHVTPPSFTSSLQNTHSIAEKRRGARPARDDGGAQAPPVLPVPLPDYVGWLVANRPVVGPGPELPAVRDAVGPCDVDVCACRRAVFGVGRLATLVAAFGWPRRPRIADRILVRVCFDGAHEGGEPFFGGSDSYTGAECGRPSTGVRLRAIAAAPTVAAARAGTVSALRTLSALPAPAGAATTTTGAAASAVAAAVASAAE